jgi:Protein of unknown function (DUF2946)
MRWVRDNIGQGSWLALVAIAINFALSFGHVHVIAGHGSEGALAAMLGASDHQQAPGHSGGPQGDDHCPICIASSAIANAMAASPPAFPLQLTATVVDRTIAPVRLAIALPRAAFQSRGPPLS